MTMPSLLARATPLLCGLLLLPALAGAKPDPDALPTIGGMAPAFSLRPFQSSTGSNEDRATPIELDSLCGSRAGAAAVLVFFVDEDGQDDLAIANAWHRRHHKDGLRVVAISEVEQPATFAAAVARARLGYSVLDDKHHVVSRRYGIDRAPFTVLLDGDCRVLGMGEKSLRASADALGETIGSLIADAKAAKKKARRR